VDVFLTPSAFLRGKLLINGYQPERVVHLPLFLPDEQFCQFEKYEGYLVFMGKLETLKGIYPLLDACRQLPQVKLILAGRVEEPIKSLLPGLLPPNAIYVGMKQGDELKHLRANARALILPSIWYENQPFSILEAFASSKPVIASNLGGMQELVKDHERGLLVEPRNSGSLASAMKWIAEHPVESRQWSHNAFQYAVTNHSAEIHYKKLEAIYRNCLTI
jgi:glycosyltransferase involved in cell wall biosynthesis